MLIVSILPGKEGIMPTTFSLRTQEFRSLPSPVGGSHVGFFYTRASLLPPGLWEWRDVNPREVNDRNSVYRSIRQTLEEEPERFHERNRGITISAQKVRFDPRRKEVVLIVEDSELHGVVDGAHTLHVLIKAQDRSLDSTEKAFVFIKTITGVTADQIAEIAGGLNTSEQVDLKSLENLRDHFAELQRALSGEPYVEDIAYKMNEKKDIDVREILYYLAVFDCAAYDKNRHPVMLFGRKEGIVRTFAKQAAHPTDEDSFRILITRVPEILRLRDLIEKQSLIRGPKIGHYKADEKTRIRNESHRENELRFMKEFVDGLIPLGWIMPMLGGFRANVDWNKPKGSFSWIVPVDKLVDACIEQLVLAIQEIHKQENSRPEYVGRNALAWRVCYNTVAQAILELQIEELREEQSKSSLREGI